MKPFAIFAVALLAGHVRPAFAQDVTPSMQLSSTQPPALDAFGGGPLTFDLAVDAPIGTHLRVEVDLTQTAGTLAAPLQKNVPVSPEIAFDHRTHQVVSCTIPALPVVKFPAPMLLQLHADPDLKLTIPVVVYPREDQGEWKKILAGAGRLAVFGEGRALSQFLRERHVEFEDLGLDWPTSPDPHTLYIGVTATGAIHPRMSPGMRLVWFSPKAYPPLLPGVYQVADGVWKVTLSGLLDHLSDDPRAQQTLATIFRQALPPRPPESTEP